MLSKSLAAVSALALVLGSSAAAAQTGVAPASAAITQSDSDLSGRGAGIYIIGAVVIALLIWGAIELLDDDEPSSP